MVLDLELMRKNYLYFFIVGLDRGLNEMYGFDINPLAVLISRTKFTKVNIEKVKIIKRRLQKKYVNL